MKHHLYLIRSCTKHLSAQFEVCGDLFSINTLIYWDQIWNTVYRNPIEHHRCSIFKLHSSKLSPHLVKLS